MAPRLLLSLLVGLVALLTFGAASAPAIVGGTPADRADYPFYVVLGDNGCGGALIAPDRVLTAAHCRESLYEDRYVRVGPAGVRRGVRRMAIHPVYRRLERQAQSDAGALPADLMVLELDRPVVGVPVLTLASAGDGLSAPGTAARAIGIGSPDPDLDSPRPVFREGDVQILRDDQCRVEMPDAAGRRWGLCTRDPRSFDRSRRGPFTSPCFGDSGGPLLVSRGGAWVGVGVVSFGRACGTKRDPEVYADIAEGRAFIDDPTPAWVPQAAARPVVRGTPAAGREVTCDVRWLDPPQRVTYDFFVGDDVVQTGRSATYRVNPRDRGKRIQCTAVARSAGGVAGSGLSRPVRVAR